MRHFILLFIFFSFVGCEYAEDGINYIVDGIKKEINNQRYSKEPRESTARKWTDGKVYYKFHDNVNEDAKLIILNCMMDFEDISSLQFIEDGSKKYFVTIRLGNKNSCSDIGMYRSTVTLREDDSKIKHELGHVIGLEHEHQRKDRNTYVKIFWDNIIKDKYHNFVIIKNSLIKESIFDYDYSSFMHYKKREWSRNNYIVIVTLLNFDKLHIGRVVFSNIDIEKIRYLYPN